MPRPFAGVPSDVVEKVREVERVVVTGLFLSNENTIGPGIDLLALVLREAARDQR